MESELKPCPFCGGKAIMEGKRTTAGTHYVVRCADPDNCPADNVKTKKFFIRAIAISVWNRGSDHGTM